MADTITFSIEGDAQTYEVPEIDDFDLDEWQVLYEYTSLILDDFAPLENADEEKDRQRRLSQPAFTKALLHIGYQRAHPELKPSEIKDVVGAAKMLRVLEDMNRAAADGEDRPPDLTTASPQNSVDSNDSESESSTSESVEQEDPLEPTGIGV